MSHAIGKARQPEHEAQGVASRLLTSGAQTK